MGLTRAQKHHNASSRLKRPQQSSPLKTTNKKLRVASPTPRPDSPVDELLDVDNEPEDVDNELDDIDDELDIDDVFNSDEDRTLASQLLGQASDTPAQATDGDPDEELTPPERLSPETKHRIRTTLMDIDTRPVEELSPTQKAFRSRVSTTIKTFLRHYKKRKFIRSMDPVIRYWFRLLEEQDLVDKYIDICCDVVLPVVGENLGGRDV